MWLERYFVDAVDPHHLEKRRTRRDEAERAWLAALSTSRPSHRGTRVPSDRLEALYADFERARDAAYEACVGWNSALPIVPFPRPHRIG